MMAPDTMVASQATSRSYYLFGAIHTGTVNSVTIVLHVACATLCLNCYNGFIYPKMSKQYSAGKSKHIPLTVPQKSHIIRKLESDKSQRQVMASYNI